jgi:hypothetical protein
VGQSNQCRRSNHWISLITGSLMNDYFFEPPLTLVSSAAYFFSAGFNFTIMYFVFAQFGTGSV